MSWLCDCAAWASWAFHARGGCAARRGDILQGGLKVDAVVIQGRLDVRRDILGDFLGRGGRIRPRLIQELEHELCVVAGPQARNPG